MNIPIFNSSYFYAGKNSVVSVDRFTLASSHNLILCEDNEKIILTSKAIVHLSHYAKGPGKCSL